MNEVDYFSGDRFVAKKFLELRNQFNTDIVIETGTHNGSTTIWLAENFKQVYTIEIDKDLIEQAKNKCSRFQNVNFSLGDSIQILPKILDEIETRCLFFLDAHWSSKTPTPKELEIIAEKCKVKPVIAIHDFCNPNNSKLRFDSYPDFRYKWENIEELVTKIYGNEYLHFYNEESEGDNVGVVYVVPILSTGR